MLLKCRSPSEPHHISRTPELPAAAPVEAGRADGAGAIPRYLLSGAARPGQTPVVQREEETSLPDVPRFQLTPPSLLQPPDPYARFRPDFGLRYRLDPQLELQMVARARMLLAPANVLAGVAPLVPAVAAPGGGPSVPSAALPPASGAPPASPSPAQTPPSPGAGAGTPRPGTGGDVLSAVLAMPQVSLLLEDVQNQFTSDFTRYWISASLGEQIGFVSSSVVVSGAMLAPVLGFKEPRDFVLPLLNDVVIPVPGLSGYGLEFRFGERDVMVGAHVDVGLLLPSVWGFGEASFKPIGGPPGRDPNALPPVSRKEEGDAPHANADAIHANLHSNNGRGRALDAGLRAQFEPVFGADLSDVRIHADARADALARALHAKAFTMGDEVFFRAGHFAPQTAKGERLLAHELTHTVQQSRGDVDGEYWAGGLRMGRAGDRHEIEADRAAEAISHVAPVKAKPAQGAAIDRTSAEELNLGVAEPRLL